MALFPPVVASSMPAFAINPDKNNNSVTIYYTLSNYNQKDSIKNVQVTVRLQSSNNNIVNNNSEILIKPFEQTEEDKLFNRYSITIQESDLSENFKIDTLYKIQLRFSSVAPEQSVTAKFFIDNVYKFSQWSTVCLIKPILAPIFYIDDFHYDQKDDYGQEEGAEDTFLNSFADFIGVYKTLLDPQTGKESSEVLKSWRLRLYTEDNTLQGDTGQVLIDAYNYNLDTNAITFKCSLPYAFLNKTKYYIVFDITTKNGFTDNKTYYFESSSLGGTNSDFAIDSTESNEYSINEEEGYIKLKFSLTNAQQHNLVIRRSDASHNFLNWTDLKIFQGKNKKSFLYYDFTAQSGTMYKYILQQIDERGRYTYIIEFPRIFMPEWEHAFLLEKADDKVKLQSQERTPVSPNIKQLKLKYDFQISSYKTNITENLTTTIGSKYPFIRRNGDNYYKSFPITGTISYYMDNIDFFTTKEEIFYNDNNYEQYEKIQYGVPVSEGEIPSSYDYVYERKFREEVEKFLYNNKPKLYKSTQEGNILIKLMEISLTPKQELNRLIYTFSATAYEIGQPSIENLCYYGIISQGLIDPTPSWSPSAIGQISPFVSDDFPQGRIFKANENIIEIIANKYSYKKSINEHLLNDFYLSHLRITLDSDPYLIIEENGTYRIYDDNQYDNIKYNEKEIDPINFGPDIYNPLYRLESSYKRKENNKIDNIYLGYLFEINDQPIIISSNGIYELKDDNLQLSPTTKIVPKKDCIMTIDYKIRKTYITDISQVPTRITQTTKIGQLYGTYTKKDNFITRIKQKYNTTLYLTNSQTGNEEKTTQKVLGVSSIQIEAEPRTEFLIQTSAMPEEPSLFVINETGTLNIDLNNLTENNNIVYITKILLNHEQKKDVSIVYTVNLERKYFNIS